MCARGDNPGLSPGLATGFFHRSSELCLDKQLCEERFLVEVSSSDRSNCKWPFIFPIFSWAKIDGHLQSKFIVLLKVPISLHWLKREPLHLTSNMLRKSDTSSKRLKLVLMNLRLSLWIFVEWRPKRWNSTGEHLPGAVIDHWRQAEHQHCRRAPSNENISPGVSNITAWKGQAGGDQGSPCCCRL